MKKFIQIIFFCFLINNVKAFVDEIASKELSEIFDGKKNINIVLVSRNATTATYPPIDIDNIALMFACLASSMYPTKKTEIKNKLEAFLTEIYGSVLVEMPNITGYTTITNPVLLQGRKNAILTAFSTYTGNLEITNPTNNWKLVVLNEMFFSKSEPLTKQEVNKIKETFFHFFKDGRVLLYANFLYTDNKKYSAAERSSLIAKMLRKTSTGMKRMIFKYDPNIHHPANTESDILFINYLRDIASIDISYPVTTLFNRSVISYDNADVVYYDKSTYCWQSNDSLTNVPNHIYHIGDSKDHILPTEKFLQLNKLLRKNISSEICYDLSCGTRSENGWINDTTKTKLHIFTSNTTQASGSTEFPIDVPVVCVDPNGTDVMNNLTYNALTVIFKQNPKVKHGNNYKTELLTYPAVNGNSYAFTKAEVTI